MKNIYLSTQIKSIDSLAAKYLNINSYELMQLAGQSIYAYIQQFKNILVVTGAGNNAGDGYVIANLARKQGKKVVVWNLIAPKDLPIDAKKAANTYLDSGGKLTDDIMEGDYDCIVDAIFGTGLCRDIIGKFAEAVNWINNQNLTTVSVDIPSGLEADTGNVMGCVIKADITVAVICYKIGLVTNNGKELCGVLYCEDLDVPAQTFQKMKANICLLDQSDINLKRLTRQHNSHKGIFGSVVIAGGHDGMLGALILSGRAALRSGCGLVEVVSNNEQAVMISVHCPELMTATSIKGSRLMEKADVIAVGPGLGLNSVSKQVLQYCIKQNKPMVIDADALTLIADNYQFNNDVVLTPHPKEAATLLNTDVNSIQNNRVVAAQNISKKYKTVTVLKGSGTVISDTNGNVYISPFGYAGMATAGMGDVLTGMVVSLMGQGFSCLHAAITAVLWHAIAAENCHKGNGLIATDVIQQLPQEIM